MKPIITASLNQQPFFFEQDAFARLESYLREAEQALSQHPDRDEVLRDLEQAIAERCRVDRPSGAEVISLTVLAAILEEIGPVNDPATSKPEPSYAESPQAQTESHAGSPHAHAESEPREGSAHQASYVRPPLEQISEGALLSGVCMGLARYFSIDVSLLRIAVIILTLISAGLAIGLYVFLMILLPYAPVNVDAPPMGRWPRKIRGWVERLRSRLSGALS